MVGGEGSAYIVTQPCHICKTGLRLLPKKTPVIMQRAEWQWIADGAGLQDAVFVDDILPEISRVYLIKGDVEIAPGITLA